MKKVKYLGIDFGSSTTSVIGFVEGEDKPIIFFDERGGKMFFYSVMAKEENGEVYFQDAYKSQGELFDELKEGLFKRGGIENSRKFLLEVAKKVRAAKTLENDDFQLYDFQSLETIYYGHPAYYAPGKVETYCSNIKKILAEGFGIAERKICGVAEPVLAACAYNYVNRDRETYNVKEGDSILVLDFGGYTLDIALMKAVSRELVDKKTRERKEVLCLMQQEACGSFESNDTSMGKKITMDLCRQIYKSNWRNVRFDFKVEEGKCKLFEGDYQNSKTSGSLQYENEVKKFCLMYKAPTPEIQGDTVYVGFTGEGRNINIYNLLAEQIHFIEAYLKQIGLEKGSIHHVLFTGGTAKMKPLRDEISNRLGDWWANGSSRLPLWMDEKINDESFNDFPMKTFNSVNDKKINGALSSGNAVALGAALVAAGECSPTAGKSGGKTDKQQKGKESELEKKISKIESENANLRAVNKSLNREIYELKYKK